MTQGRIGHGAQVWLDDASDTLTKLAEPQAIETPNYETEDVEATSHDSVGRVREYVSGMTNPGEGTWEFVLNPGGDTDLLLIAAQADGLARDFEIILPDGAFGQKFAGKCIVKRYERTTPFDDIMRATITVRFTGAVTITTLTS